MTTRERAKEKGAPRWALAGDAAAKASMTTAAIPAARPAKAAALLNVGVIFIP